MSARPKERSEPLQARDVKLFRKGRSQAVHIPSEFELPGNEAVMRKEGDRLIIEPKEKKVGLAALLASFGPWEGDVPELDERQSPPEDVDL
jgi:antitoxin VapB